MKQVQKCKAAASTAGLLQYACLFTTDELLKNLKQLDSNQKAIKAFLDKIKKLTGLSPNLPGAPTNKTLSGRHKEARSVEVENRDEDVRHKDTKHYKLPDRFLILLRQETGAEDKRFPAPQ